VTELLWHLISALVAVWVLLAVLVVAGTIIPLALSLVRP
jgi:hypothetical protein